MYPRPRKQGKRQSRVLEFRLDEHLYEIQRKDARAVRSYSVRPVSSWRTSRHLHTASIRPNFGPGGASTHDTKIFLLELIILVFTIYWLLSFFGYSIVSGVSHSGSFIDMLAIVIVVLLIIRFLS
jgi:hypothetical protein